MGDAGLELSPQDTEKTRFSKTGAAESGAVENNTAPTAPDLAKVIEVWPTLADAIKRGILAMIDASG